MNRRRAFEALGQMGSASRAELAKAVGVSAPTAGKVVDELLDARLVEMADAEADDASAPQGNNGHNGQAVMGRPGQLLRHNRTQRCVLAVQLGVRHTRLAALPAAGPADEHWPLAFRTPRSAGNWVKALRKHGKALAKAFDGPPAAVAVSVPGVVNEAANRVLLSPNLHWTEQADLAELVARVWPAPVCLVQEIRALALGQLADDSERVRTEDDRDGRSFLLADFGEGVGGAAVIDGRLFEGTTPLTGELGHTPIAGQSQRCGCGGRGCLETVVSRRALLDAYVNARPRNGKPRRRSWRELVADVNRAEPAGLPDWLDERVDAAAGVVAGAMNVLGVRQVVITGALTELPEAVIDRLREGVERSAMWARFGQVVVTAAPRQYARGLVAAAVDRILLEAKSQ